MPFLRFIRLLSDHLSKRQIKGRLKRPAAGFQLSYKRQLFTQRRKVRKEKQRVGTPKIIHLFGRSVYNRNFSFFLCDLCVLCGEMLFLGLCNWRRKMR
jgi:hypothetical protein